MSQVFGNEIMMYCEAYRSLMGQISKRVGDIRFAELANYLAVNFDPKRIKLIDISEDDICERMYSLNDLASASVTMLEDDTIPYRMAVSIGVLIGHLKMADNIIEQAIGHKRPVEDEYNAAVRDMFPRIDSTARTCLIGRDGKFNNENYQYLCRCGFDAAILPETNALRILARKGVLHVNLEVGCENPIASYH